MKTQRSMVFGLFLLVPAYNWNGPSRVEAASQEQSTTTKNQQQREREAQAQQQKRDEYVKSVQAKLDAYDKKVDGLEAKASALTGSAKDDLGKMIEQLRIEQKSIASRLGYAKNASPDGFSVVRADVDLALVKLEGSYQVVSKKLDTTPPTPLTTKQKPN